jgi:hypothetical protein
MGIGTQVIGLRPDYIVNFLVHVFITYIKFLDLE